MKNKPLQILFRGEAVKTVEKLQTKSGSKCKNSVKTGSKKCHLHLRKKK